MASESFKRPPKYSPTKIARSNSNVLLQEKFVFVEHKITRRDRCFLDNGPPTATIEPADILVGDQAARRGGRPGALDARAAPGRAVRPDHDADEDRLGRQVAPGRLVGPRERHGDHDDPDGARPAVRPRGMRRGVRRRPGGLPRGRVPGRRGRRRRRRVGPRLGRERPGRVGGGGGRPRIARGGAADADGSSEAA